MKKFLYSLAALAALSLAGCGGSEAPAPQAGAAKQDSGKASPAAAPEQLLVSIIPDPPIADGCLKVLVSGSRQATYRWEINGREVPGQSANTLCSGFRRGDEVRAIVRAGKLSGSRKVTIANSPPRITEVSVNADGIQKHAALVVKPKVVDVDDDLVELRYQWYVNGEADPSLAGDTLPAGRYARGDRIRFTVLPTDGNAEGRLYQSDSLTVPGAPPQIVSKPPERFEAMTYSYQVRVRDVDGDKVTYKLEKAPAGMTIGRTSGLVTWPLAGVKPGAYPVKIVAVDAEGSSVTQEYTLTLGPTAAAQAAKKP